MIFRFIFVMQVQVETKSPNKAIEPTADSARFLTYKEVSPLSPAAHRKRYISVA